MTRRLTLIATGIVVLLLVAYAGAGLSTQHGRDAAFDATGIGDSREEVLALFGAPDATDGGGQHFARYASEPCKPPCEERLWFENRMFFDIEAWSVSFDRNGTVVEKYHWVSP